MDSANWQGALGGGEQQPLASEFAELHADHGKKPEPTASDCYSGTGTVSAVAKQLGLKSFYIDSNPIYAAEAQQRADHNTGACNDNLLSVTRAGD